MQNSETPLAVVILAAGKGTRMKSDLPKVLHQIMGRPMIAYVLDLAQAMGAQRTVMVVGHGAKDVEKALAGPAGLSFALQEPQLGTGHAVMAAAPQLEGFDGDVLVLYGDVPGVKLTTARDFLAAHHAKGNDLTCMAMDFPNPPPYGRLILDDEDRLTRIVEDRDATEAEKAVTLVSTGIFAFNCLPLLECLPLLDTNNDQNEYYLTDLAGIFYQRGFQTGYYICDDPKQMQGVNSVADLNGLEAAWQGDGAGER